MNKVVAIYLIVKDFINRPCIYLPVGKNRFNSASEHSRTCANSFISSKLGGGTAFDVNIYDGTSMIPVSREYKECANSQLLGIFQNKRDSKSGIFANQIRRNILPCRQGDQIICSWYFLIKQKHSWQLFSTSP